MARGAPSCAWTSSSSGRPLLVKRRGGLLLHVRIAGVQLRRAARVRQGLGKAPFDEQGIGEIILRDPTVGRVRVRVYFQSRDPGL